MNGELLRIIDAIHKEKAIDKEIILEGIESALTSAARRHFPDREDVFVRINRETGQIEKEGAGTEHIDVQTLGRIAAQTAKQVIIQKIREAERNVVFADFEGKRGDILVGTVLRYDGPHIAVNLGRVEAILPKSEQMPGENYRVGERLRALVLEVKKKGQKVRVVLSRAHPDFVRRLFELEVPEIAEGTVEIRALVREPGYRTKVAVASLNARVDAVGACLGVRGSRIKNIVDELGGNERVDVIPYDENPEVFIRNALKRAEVTEIRIDAAARKASVLVQRDQLSLAIGRGGQNVRLAARLTQWNIDVFGPPEEKAPAPAEAPAGPPGADAETPASAAEAKTPGTAPAEPPSCADAAAPPDETAAGSDAAGPPIH